MIDRLRPARRRRPFGAIACGAALIIAAGMLQFWNEGRSFRQQRLLDAAREALVETSAERVHAANDGRLVFVSGKAQAEAPLLDPQFDQPADGLALRRRVEMYQWHELSERGDETAADGSRRRRTVYRYERDWIDQPVDHRQFDQPLGHENPDEFPFASDGWRALSVRLGAFRLADDLVQQIDDWRPMAADAARLPANLAVSLRGDGRYLSSSDGEPAVGDIRVAFERIRDGPLSVIAMQQGDWLTSWSHDGEVWWLVERGTHEAEQLLAGAERRDRGVAWSLRLVGFGMLWLGFSLLLAPLATTADLLPAIGRPVRWLNAVLSGLLAALAGGVAIGSGLLFHRPWLMFGALVAAVLGVVMFVRHRRRPALPSTPSPPAR